MTKKNATKTTETHAEITWLPVSEVYTATKNGQFADNLGRLSIDDQGIATLVASMLKAAESGEPYRFSAGPINVVADPATPASFDYFPELIVKTPKGDTGDNEKEQWTEHKVDRASLVKKWSERTPGYRAIDGQRRTIAAFIASVILGRDFLLPCVVQTNSADSLERVRQNARSGQRDYSKQELAYATCELFTRKPTATMGDIASLFNWTTIASSSGKPIPERNGERQHLLAIGRLHSRNPGLKIKDRLALPPTDPDFIDAKALTRDALPFVLQTKDAKDAAGNDFVQKVISPIAGEYHPDSEGRFSEDQIDGIIRQMQNGSKPKATTIAPDKWRAIIANMPAGCLPAMIAAAHLAGDETRLLDALAAVTALENANKNK
jgi:hypothetical protein